ncbi:MAG: hypothetical protein LBB76_00990 [Azoarcus sp.]|jgi:hypothetical protein|nr:hypothetical protein [Azoarcus sp.]
MKYQPTLLSFVLFAAALAVFWPGLSGGFILDDSHTITQNDAVQLTAFSWDGLKNAANSFGAGGRQLAMASFALNHLASGLDPWGYKSTGLVIHALNAMLIFFLAARILALASIGAKRETPAAFALALAWAVHPMQVSTALYVVQRMETLALFFVLLGLLAYLGGRQRQIAGQRAWPWLLGAAFLVAPGLACKESTLLFPVYCLALELTVLGFRARAAATARGWRHLYGAGVIVALILFFAVAVPRYGSLDTYPFRNFNTIERLLTQWRVLVMHLGQIILPHPGSLRFYYDDMTVSTGLFTPWTTAASGLLLVALLLAAWRARKPYPLFALGVFWFFAGHLLTSNIIPLEMVFEHRNYFALFGVLLAIAEGLRHLPIRAALRGVGIAALAAGVSVMGWLHAAAWGQPLTQAIEQARRAPDSPRAAANLGISYYNASQQNPNSPYFHAAEHEFARAARMPTVSITAAVNLVLLDSFRPAPPAALTSSDWDTLNAKRPEALTPGALSAMMESVPPSAALASPSASSRYWDLLDANLRDGAYTPEARGAIHTLLKHRIHNGASGRRLDDERLMRVLDAAQARRPHSAVAHALVGAHALMAGDKERAIRHFQNAIETGRDNPSIAYSINELVSKYDDQDIIEAVRRASGGEALARPHSTDTER